MLGSILVFILVLSILVLVHEAGHFFVARKAGVKVEEFGFGIPPRVWGKKIGETTYSINLLPFGGFVRLHGESSEDEVVEPERAFINKSKLQRTAIILAGVVMNFILAMVAFSIVYSFSGIPRETDKVRILEVTPASPAQEAGVLEGDIVKSVGETQVTSLSQFSSLVDENRGERIAITVLREEAEQEVEKVIRVTPRAEPPEEEGPLGVIISSTEIYYPPIWQRPFVGMYYGFQESFFWVKTIIVGLGDIFGGLFRGVTPKEIAGPVGIYAITQQAASAGILTLINFIGFLSVQLAILNIIPFPALDGGRILFIGIESVFGRKVLPRVEGAIHTIGMLILLALIFAITIYDVRRLIQAGGVENFVQSVFR
jgi:regulator of sigma E protease